MKKFKKIGLIVLIVVLIAAIALMIFFKFFKKSDEDAPKNVNLPTFDNDFTGYDLEPFIDGYAVIREVSGGRVFLIDTFGQVQYCVKCSDNSRAENLGDGYILITKYLGPGSTTAYFDVVNTSTKETYPLGELDINDKLVTGEGRFVSYPYFASYDSNYAINLTTGEKEYEGYSRWQNLSNQVYTLKKLSSSVKEEIDYTFESPALACVDLTTASYRLLTKDGMGTAYPMSDFALVGEDPLYTIEGEGPYYIKSEPLLFLSDAYYDVAGIYEDIACVREREREPFNYITLGEPHELAEGEEPLHVDFTSSQGKLDLTKESWMIPVVDPTTGEVPAGITNAPAPTGPAPANNGGYIDDSFWSEYQQKTH